jgi:hypothetical protein
MAGERKPDATLSVEVSMPNGERIRWDAASAFPTRVPIDPSFSTASGEGFTGASAVLRRPTDRTYPDLALLNRVRFIGGNGFVAFDGRAQGVPVGETFTIDAEGWISHCRQRKFTDLIIDRDVSQWDDMAAVQKDRFVAATFGGFESPTAGDGLVRLELTRVAQAGIAGKMSAAQYQAPAGSAIGSVSCGFTAPVALASPWLFGLTLSLDRSGGTAAGGTSQTALTGSVTLTQAPTATPARHSLIYMRHNGALTADGRWTLQCVPVVYGDHGLTPYTRDDGQAGFVASDVLRYLAGRYAPKLDLSGIQSTTYPIAQMVWREPIDFADAAKQLNSFHLWRLGVWENARMDFAPYDYSKADWQVRDGFDGVTVETTGDTTAEIFNGCAVNFRDLTGAEQRLTPFDAAELRDSSDWIAANQWGDAAWMELDISWLCSATDAAFIGSIALAEANRAKRPSTITVPMHIRDIDGGWHPSWEVRADQTIAVMNQAVPTPRLITATEWRDHSLKISTDNTIDSLAAVQTRIASALAAAGIGG